MKIQRLVVVLTVLNLLILGFTLYQLHSIRTAGGAPTLRVRGLELVDDHGNRRAQLIVLPPSATPDGQKSADTVLFRLIDPNGRPGVKIGTSADGSGISLAGDSEKRDWSGIQILAEGKGNTVKLTEKDGRVQVIKP